ncbi:MAG: Lsr2 family protein [Humibacillus sp.]|nr:Lsr2 family protein [Humibacillus sp.]MDN5780072.1 Lsr2 family protein [Humibacillus sp.]
MAQRTQITLIDDLDGKTADETVRFALDGVDYEIDLAERNARKLRAALQEWADKARRAHNRPTTRRNTTSTSSTRQHSERLAAIREWAASNGHPVSDRGRIAASVQQAYNDAHPS